MTVFGGQVAILFGLATEMTVFGGQVAILFGLATEMTVFGGQTSLSFSGPPLVILGLVPGIYFFAIFDPER